MRRLALIATLLSFLFASSAHARPVCARGGWLAAWAGVPSDASVDYPAEGIQSKIEDVFAPGGDESPGTAKMPVDNATIRAILTPSIGGASVRVHLSNRFGSVPVTFAHATIGKQHSGAALSEAPVQLTFGGKPSVTVAPGKDVVSDAAAFRFDAYDNLAISVHVPGDVGKPTEHYTARQYTYYTPNGLGDHAADQDGSAFSFHFTARPFVTGLDVKAARPSAGVVAFGDSITDGFQGQAPAGVPETREGIDANGRWPDVLGRRIRAARLPLAVANAGISGNRVLLDGVEGGGPDEYGPAALKRLGPDVLQQAGAATVIWLEGINDIGQTPTPTTQQLIGGYEQGIARMHAAGLRVLIGTLTPAGGDEEGNYGTARGEAMRRAVNNWIRSQKTADGVVDFDAAVRDPSDPSRIKAAYDGGDHLHMNLAGYKAMGDAIDLSKLTLPRCRSHRKRAHRHHR